MTGCCWCEVARQNEGSHDPIGLTLILTLWSPVWSHLLSAGCLLKISKWVFGFLYGKTPHLKISKYFFVRPGANRNA